jgi:ribonucleoside-diphosphate reductase alpha chain
LSAAKRESQLSVYSELKFKLGRRPLLKEFTSACKSNNVSSRLKTKYGFKDYTDLTETADRYNHRVVSVEFDGYEDVYNGTVDDYHNFFVVGNDATSKFGKKRTLLLNNRQCGELPLPPGDSCRLLVLNLYSYVTNPFQANAKFNNELFRDHVSKAQRLMDDIIDLELEKIDAIIAKIKTDPEDDKIKANELDMWMEVRDKCDKGRRTGTGITAEGDMLAALGLTYGTKDATDFAEYVQKELAINAYKSSCIMAKERGAFPLYDESLELDNPFLNRLKEADPELAQMMKEYGRRNIALLTIAPGGSVSILTQTTSGIECAFLVAYKRRKKVNPNDKNVTLSYVDDNGDSCEE